VYDRSHCRRESPIAIGTARIVRDQPERNMCRRLSAKDGAHHHLKCQSSILFVDSHGEIVANRLHHEILSNAFQLVVHVGPIVSQPVLVHDMGECSLQSSQGSHGRRMRCLSKRWTTVVVSGYCEERGDIHACQTKIVLLQFVTGADQDRGRFVVRMWGRRRLSQAVGEPMSSPFDSLGF
jgi:hypothetical protein